MRAVTLVSVVVLAFVACGFRLQPEGTVLSAQSLGELARQEEARRKAIKQPAKTYTNDNLRSTDLPPAPATAGAPVAAADPDDDAPPEPVSPQAPRDEKDWRGRIDAARMALTRAETLREALQTRVNTLSFDFVNRDDPAQRDVIAVERQQAIAELDRIRQEIAALQKAIVDTQEEARRANVPAGWVR